MHMDHLVNAVSMAESPMQTILREMRETRDRNQREIEGIKRQFPTIDPPKPYKARLDELDEDNANLERWITGIEKQILDREDP